MNPFEIIDGDLIAKRNQASVPMKVHYFTVIIITCRQPATSYL